MASKFNVSQQFKGILFFFIAALSVYVFHKPIFLLLGWFEGNRWEFAYTIAVWLVIVGIVFMIPMAIAFSGGTEE